MVNMQYIEETQNEFEIREAIRKAAQIELISWFDEGTRLRSYKATRMSIDPRWVRLNFDEISLRTTPPGYIEKEVLDMVERLFEPIFELPWETYFDEPKPLIDYLDRVEIMSKEEMKRAYDLKVAPTMSEINWRERGF